MADQNIKVRIDLDLSEFNKHARELSDALSKILGKDIQLVNTNLDKTAQSAEKAGRALGNAGKAANAAGADVKKSNQQWTNFALILQDLPYGFRGIQNNLPAVIGSFAGMTGPLYLAGSAIIALFTALDSGLIKFGNELKLTTNYSKEAATTYASESIELESLYRVSQNVTVSMSDRLQAAELLKKEYPGLLGFYSAEDIALGKAKDGYDKLRDSVWAYAKVKAAEQVLVELGAKQNEITIKKNKIVSDQKQRDNKAQKEVNYLLYNNLSITEQFVKTLNDLPKNGPFGPIVQSLGAMQKSTELLYGVNQEQEELNNKAKEYQDIIDGNILLAKLFKDVQKPSKEDKLNQDTSLLDRLKKEQKTYKDQLDMFYEYGALIIKEEERLAIEKANFEKASNAEIKNIKAGFQADMLVNQQEYGRAIMAIAEKNTKDYEKIEAEISKIILKNREDIGHALTKINVEINRQDIKNTNDKLAVQSKLLRGNVNGQIKIYTNAIAETEKKKEDLIEAGLPTTGYDEQIENLKNKLEGLGSAWDQTAQGISNTISGFLADSFTLLGEHIGNLMTGDAIEGIEAFQKLLASALINIGKMLVQYGTLQAIAFGSPDPFVAIAAGVAAIALGTAIKNTANKQAVNPKAFANGGIVSGPTLGLMGEYPGAKNNPEVIAPLDKLKDMIGGQGNGQFILRGQDLVLALQRSNSNLNIKRG